MTAAFTLICGAGENAWTWLPLLCGNFLGHANAFVDAVPV